MQSLRRLRKERKLSQTELANNVGVTLRTLQNWEAGNSSMTLDNAKKVAEIFKVQVQDLIDDNLSELKTLAAESINPYSEEFIGNRLIEALDTIPKAQLVAYLSFREDDFLKEPGYIKFIEEKTKDAVIVELINRLGSAK